VVAARGDFDESLRLAREAVAIVGQTDWLNVHGDALLDLAEVLRLAGRHQEATPVVEEAVRLYERKGNVVSSGKARVVLEEHAAENV
jgi:tetratricopeptide (TPR) repeat protein